MEFKVNYFPFIESGGIPFDALVGELHSVSPKKGIDVGFSISGIEFGDSTSSSCIVHGLYSFPFE